MGDARMLREALARTEALSRRHPETATLRSIVRQLDYLVSVATGANGDRSRLKDVILGVQAAREVEPLDPSLAELLYRCDAEVKTL